MTYLKANNKLTCATGFVGSHTAHCAIVVVVVVVAVDERRATDTESRRQMAHTQLVHLIN